MIATNASRARVLHDLAGLDVDVKSYEIAYARKELAMRNTSFGSGFWW